MANPSTSKEAALTVAISTMLDRPLAEFDKRYPAGEGWVYLVLVQVRSALSDADAASVRGYWSGRGDVELALIEGTGVTRSRNAAIARAGTPLLLFSDDDVHLSSRGLASIVAQFHHDGELAVLTGRTLNEQGRPLKRYPATPTRLNLVNSGRYGTVELAIRRDPVMQCNIRFDEDFGAGSANPLGDEYIFITDCIKRGLKAWHYPIDIAVHPEVSSGQVWASDVHLRSRARALRRVFGPGLAFIMSLLFVGKHATRFKSMRLAFEFLRQSLVDH